MPPSASRSGAFSPPLSSAASFSTNSQSRLNVVTRLALEGKAKQSAEAASLMLYLKMTIPIDSVNPGQIVPLFAEDNVKIRGFELHPLDSDSAPYNFSSNSSPDLHSAARALNLPPRSSKSYLSLFDNIPQATPRNRSVTSSLDERYAGSFLISGYNVCYVLPKEFPANNRVRAGTDSDGDGLSSQGPSKRSSSRAGRRGSMNERNVVQFMAALSLWIPFASKPPTSPYMLSVPLPRCLSNHIRVRLPAPDTIRTSFASLDSEDDSPGWDVATEPHVTRGSRQSMVSAYNSYADDESSEASTSGALENCLIQGTFTSTDVLRIRWASPLSVGDFPTHQDGRRRARATDVRGNMTCTVLETVADAIKMRVDYTGVFSGIWFPGVASMLALDVGLDTQDASVAWAPESEGWRVEGDAGLTGFTVGQQQRIASPRNSLELPDPSDPSASLMSETVPHGQRGRRTHDADSSSLLRAPLPNRKTSNDYSFEGSVNTMHSISSSAVRSLPSTSSIYQTGQLDQNDSTYVGPEAPITLHIDMNAIARDKLTISISGTLLVSLFDPSLEETTAPIPKFKLFGANNERISNTIRNQYVGANVELLESTTSGSSPLINGHSDSNVKKTVIPNGAQAKSTNIGCSEILIRPAAPRSPVKGENAMSPTSRRKEVHPPSAPASRAASPEKGLGLGLGATANISIHQLHAPTPASRSAVLRDGPLVIPWATAEVVSISNTNPAGSKGKYSYAVSISLPTPIDAPSEWLEFGLALPPSFVETRTTPSNLPELHVSCASVNGVPVRFETFFGNPVPDLNVTPKLDGSEKLRHRWLSWVRVRVAFVGALEIVYTVSGSIAPAPTKVDHKGKGKASIMDGIPVLVPVFSLPVSRYEISLRRSESVSVSDNTPPEITSANTDLSLHSKVFAFDVEPFVSPKPDLVLPHSLVRNAEPPAATLSRSAKRLFFVLATVLPYAFAGALSVHSVGMRRDLRELRDIVNSSSWAGVPVHMQPGVLDFPEAVTLTSTVTTTVSMRPTPVSTNERKWFGDTFTLSYSVPTSKALPSASDRPKTVEDDDVIIEDAVADKQGKHYEYSHAYDSDENGGSSLLPALYIPLAWPAHVHYEQAKAQLLSGWGRVWHIVEVILHWPLPVDG